MLFIMTGRRATGSVKTNHGEHHYRVLIMIPVGHVKIVSSECHTGNTYSQKCSDPILATELKQEL